MEEMKVLTFVLVLGIIASILAIAFVLKDKKRDEGKTINKFIDTGDLIKIFESYFYVLYDPKTKIVYIKHYSGYGSAISVLYNYRGQPMDINEYNEFYNKEVTDEK